MLSLLTELLYHKNIKNTDNPYFLCFYIFFEFLVKKNYRGWSFSPGNGPLTGVALPVIIAPPAGECWPELGADVEAVLRRTRARRRWQCRPLACSGEDNLHRSWCLPPGNGSLTGVALSVIISPPVRECWPELGADAEDVLRRTRARRRWQRRLLACSGEDKPYRS